MKRKPWPLIVLALLHFLAPVGNILINSFLANVGVGEYLDALFQPQELIRTLIFLFVPLIGGVLIYICKKWSYYLYLFIMILPFIYSYISWQAQPSVELGVYLILFYVINLLVVGYFIIPQVRQVYFDPRLRWWETKPRYQAEFTVHFSWVDTKGKGDIKNLSEGGLFIETDMKINTSGRIDMNFEYQGTNYSFKGEVVYSKPSNNRYGYGISLLVDESDIEDMQKLIIALNSNGSLITARAPNEEDSFIYWLSRLFKQRKGFVPEIQSGNRSR